MTTALIKPVKTVGELPTIISETKPIDLVRSRFNTAKIALSTRRDTWRQYRAAYHGYLSKQKQRKGRANFWFHKIFPIIELETARQVVNYMQHTPFITVQPTSGDKVEAAKKHELVVQHYIEHSPTFFIEFLRYLKYTSIYGCGFQLQSWRHKERDMRVTKPLIIHGQQFGEETSIETQTVYDGLFFKTYSPYDVFPHPLSTHISNCPWVITVDFVQADKLMADAELGIYDKEMVSRIPLNGYLQNEWEVLKQQSELGYDGTNPDNAMVCLQTMLADDRYITVANNAVVIKESKNETGEIPLTQSVKSLDPDSFYPFGTIKPILPNQKMINLLMNSTIDEVMSSRYPIWKHKSTINPASLMSMPNHKIPVRQMDDVDIMKMPEMKQDVNMIRIVLEQNMDETHGYFPLMQGDSSGPVRTATSDTIRQSEGGIRIQADSMINERLGIVPAAKNVSSLVLKFMPKDIEIRLVGAGGNLEFQKVSRQEIMGEFTYKAAGSSEAITRALAQKQMIDMFSMANSATQYVRLGGPDGPIVPVPVLDTYQALKDLYQGFNRTDVDSFLYRPELFGVPITNELLGQFNLPPIPGLVSDPKTGALSNSRTAGAMSGSVPGRNTGPSNPLQQNIQANNPGRLAV